MSVAMHQASHAPAGTSVLSSEPEGKYFLFLPIGIIVRSKEIIVPGSA